jgi:hypothetical protein
VEISARDLLRRALEPSRSKASSRSAERLVNFVRAGARLWENARRMSFDRHVFISYAHIDNEPLSADQQGWVSRFHASLEAMLSMRLGRKADIWRDKKLTGNDVFSDQISAEFAKSAVLVSVLSPRYIESDWCTREIREFCENAERQSTLIVDNKARVIKVIKTPIESEDALPPVAKQLLGYPFYIVDQDEAPIELDPAYGAELAQKYNLKVAKLAWDIAQLVKRLAPAEAGSRPVTADPSKPTVYLAESSYDRREAREALETELRMRGHAVLPEAEMPREEEAYSAEVNALLRRCDLSVHVIGGLYGTVPDGPSEKSVVVLQNELAVAQARERGLRRIIWLPEGTQARHVKQQEFVSALHSDADAQFGADLITGDIEVVKSMMRAALARVAAPPAPKRSEQGVSTLIYLICDGADRKETLPLRRVLQQAGCDVQIPLFAGDAATVRRAHEELLAECDAAILFYGAGDEAWKRTIESDLRKAQASRNQKGPIPRITYLAPPETDDKREMIELGDRTLLNGLDGTPPAEAILALASVKEA